MFSSCHWQPERFKSIFPHSSCLQILGSLTGKPKSSSSVSKYRQSIKLTLGFFTFLNGIHCHSIYMPHVLTLNPQNLSAQKENTLIKTSQKSKTNVFLNNAEHLC